MGIIVPEAVLPVGIKVSNVYMSFSGESITVFPRDMSGNYQIGSQYKVYKDATRTPYSNIKFPLTVTAVSIDDKSPYDILYEELKKLYPGSEDIIEVPTPVEPNDETSGGTLPIVYDANTPPVVYDDDAPVA